MAQACRLHLGTNLGRHGSVLLLAVVSAAKFSLVQLLRTTFLARTTLWTKAVGASKFVPQDCARGHTGYKFCFYIRCIFLGMHRPWRSGHQCTRRLVQTRSQALWKIKMATASTSGRYFLTLWICGLQPWNQIDVWFVRPFKKPYDVWTMIQINGQTWRSCIWTSIGNQFFTFEPQADNAFAKKVNGTGKT